MFAISNAMLSQVEIVQLDRWEHGPLELLFFDGGDKAGSDAELSGLAYRWNSGHEGGFLRDGRSLEKLQTTIPSLLKCRTPNLFLVPTADGYSELHAMLASVVPDKILRRHGVDKHNASFWLNPWRHAQEGADGSYARGAVAAFNEFIWPHLARTSRCRYEFFSKDSPLRLLATDHRYWMNRLYRIALARWETFPETTATADYWEPLEVLERKIFDSLPPEVERDRFVIRRPRMGGNLWDINDPEECDAVVEEMLDGCGLMEPIEPLLDLVHSHPTHEDFSDRYSWIKEDFERSFYSKRSRVRVSLVETVDDFPVWDHAEPYGYGDIVFRDLLALFDRRDQSLLIAVREGKTCTEIAKDMGHKGHASISRRLARIKQRVRKLMG